jgi:hypothetical protein
MKYRKRRPILIYRRHKCQKAKQNSAVYSRRTHQPTPSKTIFIRPCPNKVWLNIRVSGISQCWNLFEEGQNSETVQLIWPQKSITDLLWERGWATLEFVVQGVTWRRRGGGGGRKCHSVWTDSLALVKVKQRIYFTHVYAVKWSPIPAHALSNSSITRSFGHWTKQF